MTKINHLILTVLTNKLQEIFLLTEIINKFKFIYSYGFHGNLIYLLAYTI